MIICRRASSSPSKSEPVNQVDGLPQESSSPDISEPLNQAVSGIPGRREPHQIKQNLEFQGEETMSLMYLIL